MKAIAQALKNHTSVCFFDLEATGISHEIIEIAAFKATLKADGTVKKVFKPYQTYVMPKTRVGKTVSTLTGLTDSFLEQNGIPFRSMQKGLAKYLGKSYKSTVFICYGDQDPQMFIHSAEFNMDASMEEAKYVSHHCFDFLKFFSNYVTGEDGNPINLTKACQLFGIAPYGKAHTATSDAYSLYRLYEKFVESPSLVAVEYEKTLRRSKNVPEPFRILLAKMESGESVDLEAFRLALEESLK